MENGRPITTTTLRPRVTLKLMPSDDVLPMIARRGALRTLLDAMTSLYAVRTESTAASLKSAGLLVDVWLLRRSKYTGFVCMNGFQNVDFKG